MVREAFKDGPSWLQWCSKYVELIIYSVFLCIWIGGNSIVFLLASQNIKNSYDFFADTDKDVRVIMVATVVPLVLLCWIPDLRLLVPVSFLTNLINVASICVILYYTLQDLPSLADRQPVGSLGSIPIFVGLLLFTINATGLMIPLKNEMKKPKKFNSKFGVITISYVLVTLMYSFFGILCYVKFGDKVLSSVIMNLPKTTFCKIVIGLYGIGNCCFFPLISYVSFDIIWNNILKENFQMSPYMVQYEYLCRTLIALSSMVFAYIVPNIELFLSLTGTVGTSIDSLIIPALAQSLIYYNQKKYFLYFKNALIMLIGASLIVAGCYDFTAQIIKSF